MSKDLGGENGDGEPIVKMTVYVIKAARKGIANAPTFQPTLTREWRIACKADENLRREDETDEREGEHDMERFEFPRCLGFRVWVRCEFDEQKGGDPCGGKNQILPAYPHRKTDGVSGHA